MTRSALHTIRDIAFGSASANSLPHIVRLCDAALERKGLTEQEISDAYCRAVESLGKKRLRPGAFEAMVLFAREIEKLHGITD